MQMYGATCKDVEMHAIVWKYERRARYATHATIWAACVAYRCAKMRKTQKYAGVCNDVQRHASTQMHIFVCLICLVVGLSVDSDMVLFFVFTF